MILNEFILLIFAKNFKFNYGLSSIRKRFQIVSHVYVNIFLIFTATSHDLFVWLYSNASNNFIFALLSCIFMAVSFYFLRKGSDATARNITISYVHVLHFMGCYSGKIPLSMFISLMRVPSVCLLLGFPIKVMVFHITFAYTEYLACVYQTKNIFRVTLDDDQANQIFSMMLTAFLSLNYVIMTSFTQRSIEDSAWKLAHTNFQKSEDLISEIVQMAEVKNAYVLSLSHETKNLFNTMMGTIEHLSKRIKEIDCKEMLENIKMNTETIFDVINNIMDASKLYANRKVHYKSLNFSEILNKVFAAHSETLIKKKIIAKAYNDKTLPKQLWTDAPLLSQIVINIVSNIVDISVSETRLNIYAVWCAEDFEKDSLLTPIKSTQLKEDQIDQASQEASLHPQKDDKDMSCLSLGKFHEYSDEEVKRRAKDIELLRFPETISMKDIDRNGSQRWNIYQEQSLMTNRGNMRLVQSAKQFNSQNPRSAPKGFLKVQISGNKCGIENQRLNMLTETLLIESYNNRLALESNYLALWVCKQFCHKMGGEIKVYGKTDEELTFVFYIPVDNSSLTRFSSSKSKFKRNKATALVVDDYAFNRDLHKLLLEKNEVEVTLASDGQEALDIYQKQGGSDYFSFIMMDVRMPVMDGFTSAKKIREWELENNKRKVDICFVSGDYFDEKQVEANMRVKGDIDVAVGIKYLKKPIDYKVLRNIVTKYKI